MPERRLRVPEDASIGPADGGSLIKPLTRDTNPIPFIADGAAPPESYPRVLRATGGDDWPSVGTTRWVRHPALPTTPSASYDYLARVQGVVDSWFDSFSYITEDHDRGAKGLRTPQIGALHMIYGHWTTTNDIATIVMPTGTGKTETMLSALVSAVCPRLLVVVPTDPLRTQIAAKFLSLGILKDMLLVAESALCPVVGTLLHGPASVEEVDTFFQRCNVVVPTAQIAGRCSGIVQDRMAFQCPYLFIDEAHHAPAQTWHAFREKFRGRRILQFTARPFRNDRKWRALKSTMTVPAKPVDENEAACGRSRKGRDLHEKSGV